MTDKSKGTGRAAGGEPIDREGSTMLSPRVFFEMKEQHDFQVRTTIYVILDAMRRFFCTQKIMGNIFCFE